MAVWLAARVALPVTRFRVGAGGRSHPGGRGRGSLQTGSENPRGGVPSPRGGPADERPRAALSGPRSGNALVVDDDQTGAPRGLRHPAQQPARRPRARPGNAPIRSSRRERGRREPVSRAPHRRAVAGAWRPSSAPRRRLFYRQETTTWRSRFPRVDPGISSAEQDGQWGWSGLAAEADENKRRAVADLEIIRNNAADQERAATRAGR